MRTVLAVEREVLERVGAARFHVGAFERDQVGRAVDVAGHDGLHGERVAGHGDLFHLQPRGLEVAPVLRDVEGQRRAGGKHPQAHLVGGVRQRQQGGGQGQGGEAFGGEGKEVSALHGGFLRGMTKGSAGGRPARERRPGPRGRRGVRTCPAQRRSRWRLRR